MTHDDMIKYSPYFFAFFLLTPIVIIFLMT
jgi:hypothetical protein